MSGAEQAHSIIFELKEFLDNLGFPMPTDEEDLDEAVTVLQAEAWEKGVSAMSSRTDRGPDLKNPYDTTGGGS